MFCNEKHSKARCEIILLQNTRVRIKNKDKTYWANKIDLENFRYLAWYNGIKTEYQVAKKLAKIGTSLYNLTGQNYSLVGYFDVPQIKKLIDEIGPVADYFERKQIDDRCR